jgi:hypothetical protein
VKEVDAYQAVSRIDVANLHLIGEFAREEGGAAAVPAAAGGSSNQEFSAGATL